MENGLLPMGRLRSAMLMFAFLGLLFSLSSHSLITSFEFGVTPLPLATAHSDPLWV